MSRQVKKKHGLTLTSGNHYFVANDGPVRDGYTCIVKAHGYDFAQFNTVNCMIETPARQIIWRKTEVELTDLANLMDRDYYNVTPYIHNWLCRNIGPYQQDWDTYSKITSSSNLCLFFKRRKDALKFVAFIEELLDGITFSKW